MSHTHTHTTPHTTPHSNERQVEIGPCAKGKELSPLGVCVECAAGYYSPNGRKCLACPEGGLCEMTAMLGSKQVTIGVEEPIAKPGYWIGPPPQNLVRRVEQDKGYCDWDPIECLGELGCGSGLCSRRKNSDGSVSCSTAYVNEMSVDRIYHCMFHRFLYRCPFDELGCNGTLAHCMRHYKDPNNNGAVLSKQECRSQKVMQMQLIPEQQAHVRMVNEYGFRLTYDQENGTGSIGLQQDGYTCAPGYTGLKCGVCRFMSNRTSSVSGASYYRSRGICTKCISVAENDVTLSKMLYVFMFIGGIVACVLCTALYLRDDFTIMMKRFFGCVNNKKKKKKDSNSLTSVVPFDSNGSDAAASAVTKKKSKCSGRVSVEKFKIMLAYVQIMALFRTNYSIRWPGSVRELFRLMDFFDFNLVSLVALECMHRSTYYFTFLVSLALPLCFGLLLYLLKTIGVCRYERRLLNIPRTCTITGKKIKNFMEPKAFYNMRAAATIKALKDAGWGVPTPRQIRAELNESVPLLRPASSVSSGKYK